MISHETVTAIGLVLAGNVVGVAWGVTSRSPGFVLIGVFGVACALMALQ